MATIPAATDALTRDAGRTALKAAGLDQMALSLDYPRAELHDAFRGVPGAFEQTLAAAGWARAAGLPLQINTDGRRRRRRPTWRRWPRWWSELGVVFWEVFFLVPVGRGRSLGGLAAHECERIFDLLYRTQKKGRFIVKVTEAPHYRRHVAQRERQRRGRARPARPAAWPCPRSSPRPRGPATRSGLAPRGVNAGNGFLFVSHRGEIYPSGFLPLAAGNVRTRRPGRRLPQRDGLPRPARSRPAGGRCGRCEYREHLRRLALARATPSPATCFATDPWCVYEPPRAPLTAEGAPMRRCVDTAFDGAGLGAPGGGDDGRAAGGLHRRHVLRVGPRHGRRAAGLLPLAPGSPRCSRCWPRTSSSRRSSATRGTGTTSGSCWRTRASCCCSAGRSVAARGPRRPTRARRGRDRRPAWSCRARRCTWGCPTASHAMRARGLRRSSAPAPDARLAVPGTEAALVVEEYRPHVRLSDVWAEGVEGQSGAPALHFTLRRPRPA